MNSLNPIAFPAKTTARPKPPATNPRDLWPDWTEDFRYSPTADDHAEAAALLNADSADYWPESWPDLMEVSTVSDWDYQNELAAEAERLADGPAS